MKTIQSLNLVLLLTLLSIFSKAQVVNPTSTICNSPRVIRIPAEYPTIQEGINAAIDGDTILVADGTYGSTIDDQEAINFQGKSIFVSSQFGPKNCILAGGAYVVRFENNETNSTVLKGFTIWGAEPMAAIHCENSSPVIRDCVIRNNRSDNNRGAIDLENSSPIIINNLFFDNSVNGECAGIMCRDNSYPKIINNTLIGGENLPNFNHVTGVVCDSTSHAEIINSIFWNTGSLEFTNCAVSYTCLDKELPGIGNINADPQFIDTEYYRFDLCKHSPCINKGTFSVEGLEYPATDIDGKPRIFEHRIDMGAHEFQYPTIVNKARGRVQVHNGTVVTDKGTLLRGAFVGLDNPWMSMPSREQLSGIKQLGLNTIHVYAENPFDSSEENPQPGYNMDEVDSLVKWTAEDSLYLVLTMAGYNPSIDPFVYQFWDIYSERYKDETHVIYEICNEPEACGASNKQIASMEINAYDTIRAHAPETHVLLLSSVYSIGIDSIFERLNEIGKHVDWSNTSVAMHGYCQGVSEEIRAFNQQMLDSGYTVTITEFESVLKQDYAGRALIRVFEEQQLSYLNFLEVENIVDHPKYFKTMIEKSEIRWSPDFGTWPQNLTEIDYYDPFEFRWGALYDEGKGWWFGPYPSDDIEYVHENSYAAYYNLNFEDEPVSFEVLCSSDGGSGEIEIHLDSLNGPIVGVCPVSNTGGWLTYEYFTCDITTPFDGVHNIYFVFKSTGKEFLFNVRSWYFGKSGLLAPQTPYNGITAAIPGKIEAEEYDTGGNTKSYLDLDTMNQGGYFRQDGVDIDTTDDGGYCIAWTGENEWLEYTVTCEQETTMDIQLRFSCWEEPGDKLRIKLNNHTLAIATLSNTDHWYTWGTLTIEDILIPAGEQVLRLELLGGYFNLDWLNFTETEEPNSLTARGRVKIQNGTVVTDKGTLLRGCFDRRWRNDFEWEELRQDISDIKELGLNCLKIYNEGPHSPVGDNVSYMDSLVKWTREDSLYLVMTPSWQNNFGTEEEPDIRGDIDFIGNYWAFYADRYKDETHMIFEVCNEPENIPNNYDPLILQLQLNAYDSVRAYAPDAHIMFFGTVYSISLDSVFNWLKVLDQHVDWSNASVAMHGYCGGVSEEVRAFNQQMIDSGYTLIITEFESVLKQDYAGRALIRVFEEQQISYLNFLEADVIADHPEYFKTMIEKSEIRWTPDFGTWPASLTEIDYYDPFEFRWGALYDEGKGWWFGPYPSDDIEYVHENSYAAYYNLNFEDEPVSFEVLCSSDGGSGEIEIHLDSLNGPIVGVCPVSNTGGWLTYEYFTCDITTPFDGVHNIYFVFKSTGKEFLFNVRSWYFGKSGLLAPQTPYNGITAAIPGKIEAEEYDTGGNTKSYLDLDTMNQGGYFRQDGVDIDTTDDGGYCIAWTGENEWLEYTVTCEQETTMDIQLRFSCWEEPGDKLRIKLNNHTLAIATLSNTDHWYTWGTLTIEDVLIPAGEQILRLELLDGHFNLDWLNFVEKGGTVSNLKNQENRYLIYPNPAKDHVTINIDQKSTIEIYNLQGQLLLSKQYPSGKSSIPVNEFEPGSYILRLEGAKNSIAEILIIQ